MKKTLLIPVALLGMLPLHAQAQEAQPWAVSKTCATTAPQVAGQPQIQLVSVDGSGGRVNTLNVFSDVQLTGTLEGISVQVAPAKPLEGLKGIAAKSGDRTALRIEFGAEWPQFLKSVRAGNELVVSVGGETITVGLTGSGVAAAAMQRCAK